MRYSIHGLYAVADTTCLASRDLGNAAALALQGGARLLQYRDKSTRTGQRRREAEVLLQICRQYNAPLIINDDATLAAEIGADGVHLGRDDLPIARARQIMGSNAIIGVSCYNEIERACAAAHAGADYVAFGRFFPSPTKPEAVHASLDLLRKARESLDLPIVAIGGITLENASAVVKAGASAIAVISDLFKARNIRATASAYRKLFLNRNLPALKKAAFGVAKLS